MSNKTWNQAVEQTIESEPNLNESTRRLLCGMAQMLDRIRDSCVVFEGDGLAELNNYLCFDPEYDNEFPAETHARIMAYFNRERDLELTRVPDEF